MKYSEKPSERTVRRAKKEPRKAMAMSLYEAATSQLPPRTMEEMLGLPLYFAGVRIDGYVKIGDTIYAYSKVIPPEPDVRSSYVFLMEWNGIIFPQIAMHATKKKYVKKILGICVMVIKLLPNQDYSHPLEIKDSENEEPLIVDFADDYNISEEAKS